MCEKLIENLLSCFDNNKNFVEIYKDFNNEDLILLLSSLHSQLISLLELMNEKLPTGNFYNYYPAQKSRDFIFLIEQIDKLKSINIGLEDYYCEVINYCRKILKPKAGSSILPNTKTIELYYNKAIFVQIN